MTIEDNMINGMSETRNKVIAFMESVPTLNKLKGEKWYEVEDALVEFLEQEKKGN